MALTSGAFRSAVETRGAFAVVAELVPWREGADPRRAQRVLAAADELAVHPRIQAISITDGAGGHATLAPSVIAHRFAGRARDLIANVACRDRSRDELVRLARTLAADGITNLLAISGDFPSARDGGRPGARFTVDSAALLAILAGLEPDVPLFRGAVVNRHKRLEREQVPQYLKLELKIRSGAGFIVSQLGFDARKDDELVRYLRHRRLETPLLTSVYILSAAAARRFHAGTVPGCVVTDDLLAVVERQVAAADGGREFFHTLAAQQIAIARGLGYRGVVIGGHERADDVIRVLELADRFGADDWRDFARSIQFGWPQGFYYFEPDPATGLNVDAVNATYLASCTAQARQRARRSTPTTYRFSRVAHERLFAPDAPAFALGASLYRGAERARLARPLHLLEQAVKAPLFDCRDCGDCSLSESAYLCPISQCPKGERNGPCGGSREGRCEVDGRECLWTLIYDRLKPFGEEDALLSRPPTLADESLRGTSAWANTFLERDHLSRDRLPPSPS